jgi:hypothetical protein
MLTSSCVSTTSRAPNSCRKTTASPWRMVTAKFSPRRAQSA